MIGPEIIHSHEDTGLLYYCYSLIINILTSNVVPMDQGYRLLHYL